MVIGEVLGAIVAVAVAGLVHCGPLLILVLVVYIGVEVVIKETPFEGGRRVVVANRP